MFSSLGVSDSPEAATFWGHMGHPQFSGLAPGHWQHRPGLGWLSFPRLSRYTNHLTRSEQHERNHESLSCLANVCCSEISRRGSCWGCMVTLRQPDLPGPLRRW